MSLRQRIPFRFDDGEEDDHVLDEQEQEELVREFRANAAAATGLCLLGLQVVIGLSCALHFIFILKQPKESPFYALLPDRTPSPTIPLPTLFALLQILLQLHLSLHVLPPAHPLLRALSSTSTSHAPGLLQLPLSLTHPAPVAATAVAPTLALLLRHGWPDVAWWAVAGGVTLLVFYVKRWIGQNEESIKELDGMRYEARGA